MIELIRTDRSKDWKQSNGLRLKPWIMFIGHIISAILSSTYQKLLKLMEIWPSCDRNNFAQFFETRCIFKTLNGRVSLFSSNQRGYAHPDVVSSIPGEAGEEETLHVEYLPVSRVLRGTGSTQGERETSDLTQRSHPDKLMPSAHNLIIHTLIPCS